MEIMHDLGAWGRPWEDHGIIGTRIRIMCTTDMIDGWKRRFKDQCNISIIPWLSCHMNLTPIIQGLDGNEITYISPRR